MQKLNLSIKCGVVYNTCIMVPDGMTKEEAIRYAKTHIDQMPITTLTYIPKSDEVLEDTCTLEGPISIQTISQELAKENITIIPVDLDSSSISQKGLYIVEGDKGPVISYNEDNLGWELIERIKAADYGDEDAITHIPSEPYSLLENCVVCLRPKNAEPVVKQDVLNLEAYIRYIFPGQKGRWTVSCKVTPQMLDGLGITEKELWSQAMANTRDSLYFEDMKRVIETEYGVTEQDKPAIPMFAVSRHPQAFGASALLFPELFRAFCENQGWDACLIFPSSTYEVLVVPDLDRDPKELRKIVEDINENEVLPELRLEPAVYRYTANNNEIRIL